MGDRVLGILSPPMSDGRSLHPLMLTFPEKTFPTPSLACTITGDESEHSLYACALCEDIRHFLSKCILIET